MSTVDHHETEAHETEAAEGAYHEHRPDSYYVKVALVLAFLTGLEVTLSYIDIGPAFLPCLLTLMVIKFFMVVLLFMHLKFDNRLFSVLFYMGLALAVLVYCAFLLTFRFFSGT